MGRERLRSGPSEVHQSAWPHRRRILLADSCKVTLPRGLLVGTFTAEETVSPSEPKTRPRCRKAGVCRTPRRAGAIVASTILLWWGLGPPTSGALDGAPELVLRGRGETREANSFTFEISLPGIEQSGEAGSAEVRVRGLDGRVRIPGAPDLPGKTVLVAIPPAVTPALLVHPRVENLLPGVVPRPVSRRTVDHVVEGGPGLSARATIPGEGAPEVLAREERVRDPHLYSTASGSYPAEIAWLGKVGVLRDQRYVEVHLAPVRYDPALPGLRVAESFEVTVRFDGDTGQRSDPRPERHLEDVYRSAFVNYAQGTTFRVSASSLPPVDPSAAPSSASLVPTARQRIQVRQTGVVRLDHATMSSTGFASESLSTWKLTSRGVEVPLEIQDDGDGTLEPGEWVRFYGQALDDEPKTVLNTDVPNAPDLFEARDFTDENVYFLTVEAGSRARMATRASSPTMTRTPPADFEAVAHAETDNDWRPLAGNDPWYWAPILCFSGCSPSSRTDSVALPGLSQGTLPIRVVVRLRGSSDDGAVFPDHRTRISLLNSTNQTLATNNDDGSFDGRTIYTHDFTYAPGGAVTNPVSVRVEPISSGAVNRVVLDAVDLRYRRAFTALSDALTFDWIDEDAEFVVSGLSGSAPAIYEVTKLLGGTGISDTVRLTGAAVSGAGPYAARFRMDNDPGLPDGSPRRFVVAGDAAIGAPAPADFSADTVSDLRSTSNQADLLVIAHPTVVDASPSSALSQFLAHRASQGISSKIAMIRDVQDEFGDGLEGPLAIRSFLQWVMSTGPGEGWASPKPAYVLLLGDGSYQYKGGEAAGNLVPTQILFKDDPSLGYYASDNLLADVDGDQTPDLVVGRISARSMAESNLVFQKVLDYELSPPAGNWRRNALFVSDRGKGYNVEEAVDFESMNDQAESFMRRPPFTTRKLRYWSDFCGGTCPYPSAANAMRAAIKAGINGTLDGGGGCGAGDGAALVQYSGHGNFDWWSDDAFFDDFLTPRDSSFLVNGTCLPWLMVHTCLSAGFHTTSDHSMGEDWLKRSGGGAIAIFSPTGLNFNFIGQEVIQEVWNDVFGPRKSRSIAVPLLDSIVHLCVQGWTEACQNYTYLGDPSLTLTLPSVAPAGPPQASPGNGRVDLSWAASSTAGVTYDLYRATSLVPPNYAKLNASPIVGTVYADTAVVNTTTYYYYTVAVDPEGFESRWSNFNSDCAVSGPDCVRATPSNPNPPATPTGVTAVDTERGSNIRVTWNANPEADIRNYTVLLGATSGLYTSSFDAGRATSYGIVGLTNGTTYYVAVTATNTSLHTSGLSGESSAIPTSVQGIKPPSFIQTLRVNKSGSSTVLSWGAVTTDIYGKPETVANYEVYRGTTVDFIPSLANRIGTPTAPTFTDVNALAPPARYYYLVRAMDGDGNGGGLGFDVPAGISALTVVKGGDPTISLSWPAVTTDFSGRPTRIASYEVYASASPFTRAQIRDGIVPLLTTVTGVSLVITPPAGAQYYSVIVVDTRQNRSPF